MNNIEQKYFNNLIKIAKENNALLISKKWNGATKYHQFLISGKIVKIKPTYIKQHGWPENMEQYIKFHYSSLKSDDEHLLELDNCAKKRGGRLLSKKWEGLYFEYEFIDIMGDIFKKNGGSIKAGHWKKEGLIAEECCRQAMQYIFNKTFKSTRKILTSKIVNRTRPLELDGYNEELKIAFEYQGHQSHWDQNNKNYHKILIIDNIKIDVCEEPSFLWQGF